ncbi:hypothetical protein QR305_03612 [Bacteroides finegoldii]|jgi:putative member of asn/thr-rich large protein|uniref:IPT/TIG domain-containing protein n=1 Tax=Bacteroides finegoldii CL09T03C10 TaxID=997888 RepID=K5CIX0_9BACE|nr:hypothetical protein [Bacteroides finegoldii]EKJ89701.1 hypothetical protein HMPREF1057_03242 [Bacteroides finegoldii CL09T03C10]
MRKIWLLMLMACTVMCTFTACSSDDEDDSTSQLPVSGVNIPTSAAVGSEVIIRGSGFTASGVNLYLENASKERTKMDAAFSSSGVTFTVPMTLVSGVYNVILTQSGNEWTLGSITLTDADSPITSPSLSDEAVSPGSEVTLGGSGYADGDKIVLKAEGAEAIEIAEATVTADGLTFTLPADCPEGKYTVSLVRGANSWVLDNVVLKVQKAMRVKSIYMDMGEKGNLLLDLGYDAEGRLSNAAIADMELNWDFEYDGNTIKTVSCMAGINLVYTLRDGKIVKATAADMYDETEEFNTWSYEGDYLSSVINPGKDYGGMDLTFAYNADGNLEDLDFGIGGFVHYVYGDASLSAIPNTIDPAIALHLQNLVFGKEDAALAFLLNKTGNVSKKIPSSLQIPVAQDETTGELIYQTYAITATMNNNVLSIDCGNALEEVGVPNIKITYEK